jgi:hypothetical protein
MYEVLVTILIFIGVIAVTVLLFGGWLVVALVRGFTRLLIGPEPATGRQRMLAPTAPNRVRCARPRCHAENPVGVRFCRRCGTSFEAGRMVSQARHRPPVRHAAVL